MKTLVPATLGVALLTTAVAPAIETITVRSGQSGAAPGAPGAPDDVVTFNPWGNPGGAPVLNSAFALGDFTATDGGPSAAVISPVGAWMGGAVAPLSDPLARWIGIAATDLPGLPQVGAAGSALYSVPFTIQSQAFTKVVLCIEGGVDDSLGDSINGDSPNLEGLYVNGLAVPSSLTSVLFNTGTFNFAVASTHVVDITNSVLPGPNRFYLYQRDLGFGVSGIIFSATIKVIPEPGAAALLAASGAWAFPRRSRGRAVAAARPASGGR